MVKLTDRQKQNFQKKVDIPLFGGCHEWKGARSSEGYGSFRINEQAVGAHRVAFLLEYGYLPENALHTCDNPSCVNPEHLYDGTRVENGIDRAQRGSDYKLTPDNIREIRYLRALDFTYKSIAKRFGVSISTIYQIITGKIWSHVTETAI